MRLNLLSSKLNEHPVPFPCATTTHVFSLLNPRRKESYTTILKTNLTVKLSSWSRTRKRTHTATRRLSNPCYRDHE
jgi:hypothetical protein